MERGSKVGFKRTTRKRFQPKENGSGESDEEYKLEEDEEFEESDDYCSLDGDESEELLAEYEEEDEEEDKEEKNVKSTVRLRPNQKCSWQRKTNRVKQPQKKRRVSPKLENDVVEEDDDYEDEDEDEDEDDEEFMLDESDCVDEEDEMPVMKKSKKVSRSHLEKRSCSKGRKRSRKSKVLRKPVRQVSRKNRLTRKTSSVKNDVVTKKSNVVQWRSRKKRRTKEDSDSNFISSPSSDVEYTISEEEREQVREASKFCTNLNTSLRCSSSVKRFQEEETVCLQGRRTCRKGKEKAMDMKNEVVNQVCGICLSEEQKKTVRGLLDCCSHSFCFACIMEWSKVESRCPLCKQRFMTISKPASSNTGFELRTVVIQVPERDQVYQPSEEELQGYLEPYENVICTECHQGGEDAFMLLCDICDSPSHTFCVGLGYEVPEGNWYCDTCRPAAFAPLNLQGMSPTPDQRTNMSVPPSPFPVGIDLNVTYVPDTPLTQETRNFPSIRRPMGDHYAGSPVFGTGAFIVSDRRRIQHHVNNLLNNRTSQEFIRSNGISASSSGVRLFGSQLDQGRAPLYSDNEGRLEDNAFSVRSSPFSGQAEHGGFGMAFNHSLDHEQLHPCTSRSNIGADSSLSPYACREAMASSRTSQDSLRAPFHER